VQRSDLVALGGKAEIRTRTRNDVIDQSGHSLRPTDTAVEAGFSLYQNVPLSRYDALS